MEKNDWGKAEVILQQLGGYGRLAAMVAATNFTYRPEGTLGFYFKGCKKANVIQIRLNESDLYDVEFYKYNKRTYDVTRVAEYSDVYAEDLKSLIENYTGLLLSL